MKILVTAASRHGATSGIAAVIGRVLEDRGHDVRVATPDDVRTIDAFDAVVLGSAVYAGRWLGPAKLFVEKFGPALQRRPVWLFSSGPIGDERKLEEPVDIIGLAAATHAREHHIFGGRLDKDDLGFVERTVVGVLRAPEGDFRDWDEIRAWAGAIADALVPVLDRAGTPIPA
jgi:menaquinone-dependent protoporphyrinogen oxidase